MPKPKQKLIKPNDFSKEREEALRKVPFEDTKWTQPCRYSVLIDELYGKGLEVAARVFEKSVEFEGKMERSRRKLNEHLPLLMDLFDKAVRAEFCWRTEDNMESKRKVCKHLYGVLLFLDVQDEDFRWLYKNCCKYFVKFFKMVDVEASDEIVAKVLYRFALALLEDNEPNDLICEALAEALILTDGHLWDSDFDEDRRNENDLHTGIAMKISEVNTAYAQTMQDPNDQEKGLQLMETAIKSLGKANMGRHVVKFAYYKVYLKKIKYLMSLNRFEEALEQVKSFHRIFSSDEANDQFREIEGKAFELEGLCAIELGNIGYGIKSLLRGLGICTKFGFQETAASINFNLGKAHLLNMNIPQSNIVFKNAASIYEQLGDQTNLKRVRYMTAKLQCDAVFTEFLGLIKERQYSSISKLLNWSLGGKTFWNPNSTLELQDYLAVVTPPSKKKYIAELVKQKPKNTTTK